MSRKRLNRLIQCFEYRLKRIEWSEHSECETREVLFALRELRNRRKICDMPKDVLPPIADSTAKPSPEARRDIAIANFFEVATSILRKVEPLIDLAIATKKENRR